MSGVSADIIRSVLEEQVRGLRDVVGGASELAKSAGFPQSQEVASALEQVARRLHDVLGMVERPREDDGGGGAGK